MLKILTNTPLCRILGQITGCGLVKNPYSYAPGHDLLAVLTWVKLLYLFCLFL